MLPLNVFAIHCPLNVTPGMAWTTKGIDSLNRTTIITIISLHEFHSSSTPTYSPDWCCADFWKYISCIIKIQSQQKETFSWTVFNTLMHQHHLVEFYLTMAKKVFEVFQVVSCSIRVTYNVNVRHTKSLMLNINVSHAVYKSLFDEVHSGVHCSFRSVTLFRIHTGKFSKQLTYFSVACIMTLR